MTRRGDFTFILCETAEQIESAKRLRHEVFCLEKGWIDQAAYVGDAESDEYDDDAVHFLALENGVPVGTSRYLLGERTELPAAKYLSLEQFDVAPYEVVEVSRLATRPQGRSQDAFVFVGLTLRMWEWAMEHSVTVWLAVADVPLYHMLTRMKMPLIAKGRPVDYLGSKCVPIAFDMPKTGDVLKRRMYSGERIAG
jgi:N-acyl-L-homoserine lactone synthetase